MDSLRGRFSDRDDFGDRDYGERAYDLGEDETGHEPPPSPVGQDERRMQVRAYNHWASLLGNRSFPSIEDLEPEGLPEFGPYSVLLDFTGGTEDPGIPFLGAKLGRECLADHDIDRLSDVPSRSLLSRITDHYMQILANQAPIGFEAEFVNVRGATILYRGILLPFSSDDETIDFIYGVINWKELADQKTSDELLLEIDQALDAAMPPLQDTGQDEAPLTAWADGPTETQLDIGRPEMDGVLDLDTPFDPALAPVAEAPFDNSFDLTGFDIDLDLATLDLGLDPMVTDPVDLPAPDFGEASPPFAGNGILAKKDRSGNRGFLAGAMLGPRGRADEVFDSDDVAPADAGFVDGGDDYDPQGPMDHGQDATAEIGFARDDAQFPQATDVADILPGDMDLTDWLAAAREMAEAAKGNEDRSRQALYAAIGRAYDFSLAAMAEPAGFEGLVAEAGLTVQDRAPMTPVVKLVFGADYDKTRLTEYASALSHGHRLSLGRGALAGFLLAANGGLKGVVQAERALKREETGKSAAARETPGDALARKLRKLDHHPLAAVDPDGREFTLLLARRLPTGEVVLLGEVDEDVAMLERAARKLIG